MTYQNCLKHIESIDANNYKPDHENSLRLMTYLGHPEENLKVVHVAGSNGKGSTIQFIKHIMMEAGYSVGSFMSPHILSPLELVSRNNEPISETQFQTAFTKVLGACESIVKDGYPHPTTFEILTAMAIVHLADEPVDLALIEVGMGGRYDSTNVFSNPLLTVITSIDYDHQQWLGSTLNEIAGHKAGIIKKNVPTILGPNKLEVVQVITEEVREKGGKLYLLDQGLIHVKTLMQTINHQLFHIKSPHFDYKALQMTMIGEHQYQNLAIALLTVKHLRKYYNITSSHIKKGVKSTSWTCRNDIISKDPLIMLDGGHNLAGVEAMAQLIESRFSDKNVITVFGVMKDKAHEDMLNLIQNFSSDVIITEPLSPRKLNIDDPSLKDYELKYSDYKEALKKALELVDSKTLILVMGSLYLAYPAKEWFITELESD